MQNQQLSDAFSTLSTPLVADAFMSLGLPLRIASASMRPLISGSHIAGRVLPVRHFGSVDIILEAIGTADQGDILVIDNSGRADEGCIGDLTALEAQAYGLAGIVVWGYHRDTTELLRIGFPVFSHGACLSGPQRLDPRHLDALDSAKLGDFDVRRDDVAFADDDGVLFASGQDAENLLSTATTIWQKERRQAEAIQSGKTLHDQLRFDEYMARRSADPSYSFRKHLRQVGGAIEE